MGTNLFAVEAIYISPSCRKQYMQKSKVQEQVKQQKEKSLHLYIDFILSFWVTFLIDHNGLTLFLDRYKVLWKIIAFMYVKWAFWKFWHLKKSTAFPADFSMVPFSSCNIIPWAVLIIPLPASLFTKRSKLSRSEENTDGHYGGSL